MEFVGGNMVNYNVTVPSTIGKSIKVNELISKAEEKRLRKNEKRAKNWNGKK